MAEESRRVEMEKEAQIDANEEKEARRREEESKKFADEVEAKRVADE